MATTLSPAAPGDSEAITEVLETEDAVTPASQEDDGFFALVAHDLRGPLNVIAGWTRMLQGGGLTPEERARALEAIARSVTRQAQVIDDLENGSRTTGGKMCGARAGTARSR